MKVGIILIEFKDVKHYKSPPPPFGNRPDGYLKADFDSMMFSYNYWYAPDPQFDSPHPENELVFGSFRDYWDQMSRGKLRIEGRVANPTDENGVPIWLVADSTKEYYYNSGVWYELSNETIQKALDSGYVDTTNTFASNYFDKLVIVYAGMVQWGGALIVHGHRLGGKYIQLAERSSKKLHQNSDWSFTHIGVYLHEFGHNLGFPDEYYQPFSQEYTDILNYCLMAWGIYNGPLEKGECPSTLSPYHRLKKNWVSSVTLIADTSDFVVEYDYANSKLYRINPIYASNDEHYIIESRNREGFDLYIPTDPADTVDQPGRLLVWHHDIDPYPFDELNDRIMIKPADNLFDDLTKLTDFFPKQFNPNSQDLTDITLPAATLGRIGKNFSNERPAHFSLNGIQKLSDNNTLIREIKLNDNLAPDTVIVIQNYSSGWRTVSVPVVLSDFSLQSVFPSAISAFRFLGQYIHVTTLENGPGYWVNFETALQKTFVGWPLNYLNIVLWQGWNLTGTISSDFPVSNICTEPADIVEYIYGYENGYILMTEDSSLIPGKGYWIKSTESGRMILDKQAGHCQLSKLTSFHQIDLSSMDKFIITDSEGFSQTLFVCNTDIDTNIANVNLELPPMFPEIDFDSRFEFNEYVKRVSADSGAIDLNILVHTFSYPVIISWELNPENGIDYSFIPDSIMGKSITINTASANYSFNDLIDNKIKLNLVVNRTNEKKLLPKEFYLAHNYPNPFNPVTTIEFSIPKESHVNLTVFNILGEKVTEIKNEILKPGYYKINYDASKLASGIYFYRIHADDFIKTKKMILLR